MSDKQNKLREQAEKFFACHPRVKKVFVFEDGMLFKDASEHYAKDYERYHKAKPQVFLREEFEPEVEEKKASNSKSKSTKTD